MYGKIKTNNNNKYTISSSYSLQAVVNRNPAYKANTSLKYTKSYKMAKTNTI